MAIVKQLSLITAWESIMCGRFTRPPAQFGSLGCRISLIDLTYLLLYGDDPDEKCKSSGWSEDWVKVLCYGRTYCSPAQIVQEYYQLSDNQIELLSNTSTLEENFTVVNDVYKNEDVTVQLVSRGNYISNV